MIAVKMRTETRAGRDPIKQLAKQMRVSPRYVRRMVEQGRIRIVQVKRESEPRSGASRPEALDRAIGGRKP